MIFDIIKEVHSRIKDETAKGCLQTVIRRYSWVEGRPKKSEWEACRDIFFENQRHAGWYAAQLMVRAARDNATEDYAITDDVKFNLDLCRRYIQLHELLFSTLVRDNIENKHLRKDLVEMLVRSIDR